MLRKYIKEKRAPDSALERDGSTDEHYFWLSAFLALKRAFLIILSRDQHMVGAVLHPIDRESESWQWHFYILNLDFYFIIPNTLAKLQWNSVLRVFVVKCPHAEGIRALLFTGLSKSL